MKTLLLSLLLLFSFNTIAKDLTPIEEKYKISNPEHFENYLSAYEIVNNWHNSRTKVEDLNKAEKILKNIIKKNDKYAPAHRELGRVYSIMGDHLSAVESVNKSLHLEPDYADAYVLLGFEYLIFYKLDSAKSALERAEELGSKNPWLDLNYGFIYKREGDYESAFKRCEKVYNSNTNNLKAKTHSINCLITYYKEKKNYDAVNKYYKELITLDIYYFEKHIEYATFLLLQKNFEGSIRESKALLAKTKAKNINNIAELLDVSASYGIWGDYVYNNGNNDHAITLLEKANKKLAEINIARTEERVSFADISKVFTGTEELKYLSDIFIEENLN